MRPSQTAHSLLAASAALALALSSGVAGAADGDGDGDGDPSLNPLRYSARSLIEGMAQPMEFEVAPDGRIFIIELGGKVKLLKPDGAVLQAAEIEVFAAQENGLLGLALDPAFAANGWLYLMYSPPDFAGQRISRFTVEGDALDRKSETVILEWGTQRRECCHHAGCMEFGPDGNLYAATGDNTHPHADSGGYAPIDERPDRGPWDAQKSAANPGDLRGKILRIKPKPEGGCEIPPGNLFPPGTPGTRPEIYAMGCRNPWRMTIDPATGFVYWGEVGPDAGGDSERGPRGYDEINQARGPGNHGWPYFIADNQPYADFDCVAMKAGPRFDPAKPRNEGVNNTGAKDLPPAVPAFIYWPYGKSERWPELGEGGRTACAGAVFHFNDSFRETGGFPERYDGCLLFFDWQRPFIKWARMDADSRLQGIEDFISPVKIKRPTQARFAPDGTLYLLDFGETWGANADSRLLHLTYTWGNLPPAAAAQSDRADGPLPLRLNLGSEGSADPEGKPLRYEWRLMPADRVLSTEAAPSVALEEAGDFQIVLTVTDAEGAQAQASVNVTAGNTAPEVEFEVPRAGDFYTPGQPIAYRVRVRDAEQGDSQSAPDAFAAGVLVSAVADSGGAPPPGLALIRQADCFNCHHVQEKLVGPPFLAIADKYRGQAGAADASVERVIKGSTGVWGPIPMLPHGHHTRDQIRAMVDYIYGLDANAAKPAIARGLAGEIPAPPSDGSRAVLIDAVFTDAGAAPASPLVGKASLALRARRIEAEQADAVSGSQALGGSQASGGRFIGAIADGHHLLFKAINLGAAGGLKWRVASAGQGAAVELRLSAPDGPLLSAISVEPTGGWENWVEKESALGATKPNEAADVYVVFKNPGKSGLMNLDWIEFLP